MWHGRGTTARLTLPTLQAVAKSRLPSSSLRLCPRYAPPASRATCCVAPTLARARAQDYPTNPWNVEIDKARTVDELARSRTIRESAAKDPPGTWDSPMTLAQLEVELQARARARSARRQVIDASRSDVQMRSVAGEAARAHEARVVAVPGGCAGAGGGWRDAPAHFPLACAAFALFGSPTLGISKRVFKRTCIGLGISVSDDAIDAFYAKYARQLLLRGARARAGCAVRC